MPVLFFLFFVLFIFCQCADHTIGEDEVMKCGENVALLKRGVCLGSSDVADRRRQ